jgi:hypothetical protein
MTGERMKELSHGMTKLYGHPSDYDDDVGRQKLISLNRMESGRKSTKIIGKTQNSMENTMMITQNRKR